MKWNDYNIDKISVCMNRTIGCSLSMLANDLDNWDAVINIVEDSQTVKNAVKDLVTWGFVDWAWVQNKRGGIPAHEIAKICLDFKQRLKEYVV